MHRRDFLRLLLASPIAATLDLERLLWIPDEKKIFIPSGPVTPFDFEMWVVREGMKILRERLTLVNTVNRMYDADFGMSTYGEKVIKIAIPKRGGSDFFLD